MSKAIGPAPLNFGGAAPARSPSGPSATTADQALTGKKKSEAEQLSWQFWGLVKAVYRLASKGPTRDAKAAREMFQTAQWAIKLRGSASLAQMAARGASGEPKLAALVRERQDLVAEWQKRDGLRNAWLGQPPDKRDAKAEADNQARLAAIEKRIAEIDQDLAAKFPDYAALASSRAACRGGGSGAARPG